MKLKFWFEIGNGDDIAGINRVLSAENFTQIRIESLEVCMRAKTSACAQEPGTGLLTLECCREENKEVVRYQIDFFSCPRENERTETLLEHLLKWTLDHPGNLPRDVLDGVTDSLYCCLIVYSREACGKDPLRRTGA